MDGANRPAPPDLVQWSVRAIIAVWPQTVDVFARHGLMGCGGEAGPDESLDFFARVHQVPLDTLTQELVDAIGTGRALAPARPAAAPTPAAASGAAHAASEQRFVPFFVASLALTLTFGATLGMINLARLTATWGLGALPRPSVWAHAYVQVFGFVGLFIMGVAYHVMPRFAGVALQAPALRPWSFWLQVMGVVLVATGFFLAPPLTEPLWIAGASALVAAAALFASSITRTLLAGRAAAEPFARWVVAGLAWLVASSIIACVAAVTGDTTWHHVLWPAALLGFAANWIFGVGRRIFPVFLGWEPRWAAVERGVFLVYQVGVAAWSLGAWPEHGAVLPWVRGLGAVALMTSVTAYAGVIGLFGRHAPPGGPLDRGYERYIYAAWAWLFIGLAAGPAWTLAALARGAYGSVVMLDFARHAVALGFVTQMIMGVASRVLPVFTGHALWSPRARTLAFWLINIATGIRGLEAVVAAGYWPGTWPLIALSGPPAVLAVSLFALNIIMTVRGAGRADAVQPQADVDLPDRLVAQVIEMPGALDVLVEAGFTPLRNPVMRAAFAGTVTLRQACRLKNVPLAPLVERLQSLERAERPAAAPPPRPHTNGQPVIWVKRAGG